MVILFEINTVLDNGAVLRATNQGDDIQVKGQMKHPERWFTRHSSINESFEVAAARSFSVIADEENTKYTPRK